MRRKEGSVRSHEGPPTFRSWLDEEMHDVKLARLKEEEMVNQLWVED